MKLLEKILVATNLRTDSDQTVQAAVSVAKTFNQLTDRIWHIT